MSIHDEHRKRLKDRFLEQGLDGFTEIQILELLLFFAIARRDTNSIAHALLSRFGSLARVLDAPMDKLVKVEGIGEHSAILIKLAQAMGRAYEVSKRGKHEVLNTIEEIGDYLMPLYRDRKNETVFLLCLDAKKKVLSCDMVGEGSINSASVPIRRVVEMALDAGASAVALAHNHPSGIAMPSVDDIQTTRRVATALSAVDITLLDHFIFGDDGEKSDYTSMVLSGYRFDDCLIY